MILRVIEILAGAALFLSLVRWWRGRRLRRFYRGVIPGHEDDPAWTFGDQILFAAAQASYDHCAPAHDPMKGLKL